MSIARVKTPLNLFKTQKTTFSIIHNYHSPHQMYLNGRIIIHDEKIDRYNKYIQSFLTKRFTHKKEIPPKIKIINTLKSYHNTLYIQNLYPLYTLYDIGTLKFKHSVKAIDSGYIMSRFLEDYEKNTYDAMLSKVLVCGREPFLEDYDQFKSIKDKINKLIKVFYNGDELSPFEREIERAYLQGKQLDYHLNNRNQEIKKKQLDIFLSYSEMNKLSGHTNFRMRDLEYFFSPTPKYESIDLDIIFNTLYEIRLNNSNRYLERLKINYQYRDSLKKGKDRVHFLCNYIFKQIFQYIDCWEFNNQFKLNLNFKFTLNMLVLHAWFLIQRLKNLAHTNNSKEDFYPEEIISGLIAKIAEYADENNLMFGVFHEGKTIFNYKDFITKLMDHLSWHFYVLSPSLKNTDSVDDFTGYENLKRLITDVLFLGKAKVQDQKVPKLSSYTIEHFNYFNSLSYYEIERNMFDFSVHRIKVNYRDFLKINDLYSANLLSSSLLEERKELLAKNLAKHAYVFLAKKPDLSLSVNPYLDESNFRNVNYKKSYLYRIAMFIRREYDPVSILQYKAQVEAEDLKKNNITIWDADVHKSQENYKESSKDLGLNRLNALKLMRDNFNKEAEKNNPA